jgi:hypothetical protein
VLLQLDHRQHVHRARHDSREYSSSEVAARNEASLLAALYRLHGPKRVYSRILQYSLPPEYIFRLSQSLQDSPLGPNDVLTISLSSPTASMFRRTASSSPDRCYIPRTIPQAEQDASTGYVEVESETKEKREMQETKRKASVSISSSRCLAGQIEQAVPWIHP